MNGKEFAVVSIIWIILTTCWVVNAYNIGLNKGYEQGQIDAINGHIKFVLIANEDGSSSWKECQDAKK